MKRLIFLLPVLALIAFGCGTERTREDKVSAIINKVDSPFFIVNTTPRNLIDKSGAMDGALPYTQEMLLGFFIDEEVTGVDYDIDVQIIVAKGPSFAPNFYGIFKIKNEIAFIELMETEANAEIQEKDGFKYVIKESDMFAVVWNEEFAIASNIPLDFADMLSGGSSKQGPKTVDKSIALIQAAEEGEINDTYKGLVENESDIAMRFEGKGFYQYLKEMSMMGDDEELEANREAIEGANTEMYLNFNNGSIDLQILNDLSDKLKEEIGFFNDGAVDSKLLSYGNSDTPIMLMGYNADISKAADYSKEKMSPYDYEEFEEELEKMGLSVEDAKTALTGDILFIMDRVEIKEEVIDWGYGEPYVNKEPMPVFALVLGIADASVLTEVLGDSEMASEGVMKNGDAFIVMQNDILFSTNDSLWAVKVQAGNGVKVKDEAGVLAGNPFGIFVNFAPIAQMPDLDDAEALVKMMKDIRATGNIDEANISFTLNDATKNSLRVLTETISNLTTEVEGGAEYEELEAELEAAAAEEAESVE